MRLEATPQFGTHPTVRLCGCGMLSKARKGKATVTRLGRYVDAKAPAITRRLQAILSAAAKRGAAAARAVVKSDESVINAIIAAIDPQGLSNELLDDITPDVIDAYKRAGIQGAMDVLMAVNTDITSQIDSGAVAWAQQRGGELMKDFADTTEQAMRDFLGEAVAAGMSADDLAAAIGDQWAFGEVRAEMIARTELAFSHVQGNVQGWRETGLVERKRWILGDLHEIEDECDDCVDAGDVGLEDEFIDGIAWPPAHPRCLCDLVPVTASEDQGD